MKVRAIYKEVGKQHKIRNIDIRELTEMDSPQLPDELSDMTLSGCRRQVFLSELYGTLMLPHSKSVVAGEFVITGVNENNERCSLTDEQIERAEQYLAENEIEEKLELGAVYCILYYHNDVCPNKKEIEM